MSTQKIRYPALQYRDFRLLWIGQFISGIGSQMQIVALTWHIYFLTHSPFLLGMIGLSRFLPLALFSLLGGAVADAKNRKRIMLVTQTSLLIFSGVLAVTTFTHTVTPLIIYSMTILSAVMISFDQPARQAILPSLVSREHFPNATSLNVILFQSALVAGPALAGMLIGTTGVGLIYALNTLSYLAVIFSLFAMHATGDVSGEPSEISWQSIREGLSFVRHSTIIWSTMILDFLATFLGSATTLMPIFVIDILKVSPFMGGFLYSASSVGAIIAGFIMAHVGRLKHEGKILLSAVSVYALATILFAFSHNYWLSLGALFFVGAGDSVSTVIRNTIRNLSTPDYIRGRMNSIMMIFVMGGPQLGEFEAGVAAQAFGTALSVGLGGVGTLIAIGLLGLAVPVLRNYKGTQLEPVISH